MLYLCTNFNQPGNMKRITSILLFIALAVNIAASPAKKVFVNKDMHIVPSLEQGIGYLKLSRQPDHLDAKLYDKKDRLLANLCLQTLTPDTCVYIGWQQYFFFNELKDAYRYEDNQPVEHISYRAGKPIFHLPLQDGDTIWMLAGAIVFPDESQEYGIVQSIDARGIKLNRYRKSNDELFADNCYGKIQYGDLQYKGMQTFYKNGKRYKLENYNAIGKKIEELYVDTLGKVTVRATIVEGRISEKNYFYPDGHLCASKSMTDGEWQTRYFLPDGTPTDSVTLDDESADDEIHNVVEQMPAFPGGQQALFAFLSKNVHYPPKAQQMGLQGRVILSFTVEKDGSIADIIVLRSVHKLLDDEAMRVVRSMPKWRPGKQNGKPVRVRYTIPLSFRFD